MGTELFMKKFTSIEGLRGWLAWTVVLGHVALATGIKGVGVLSHSAACAVFVFVIISGFVITHLLIERRESYLPYIFRRFMRIFPLFAVTSVIGYFTLPLLIAAASRLSWGDDLWFMAHRAALESQIVYFWPNFAAHLTMLHGVISNDALPNSALTFNSPAWSLSLEWQFYLLAPLILAAIRKPQGAIITICVVTLLCAAYRFGAFGTFDVPSLLFASAPFFVVGIASRIAYPLMMGTLQSPAIVATLLVALMPIGWEMVPLCVWGCVYAAMIASQRNRSPLDGMFLKVAAVALESAPAMFMGARSYSIYLIHMPVISATLYTITWTVAEPMKMKTFLMLLPVVAAMTFGLSCLLYVTIEKPGISLGKMAFRKRSRSPAELALPQSSPSTPVPASPSQ